MGKQWKQWQVLFSWAPKSLWMVTAASKLKDACSLEDTLCQPIQHIKKQRHHFADKGLYSQSYGFSSSQVWMWELGHKEGWGPKNCGAEELTVPWIGRRANQSTPKGIYPEYSLEGLMLKLQSFGHRMRRADSLEKTLILGKTEGKRRREGRGWYA